VWWRELRISGHNGPAREQANQTDGPERMLGRPKNVLDKDRVFWYIKRVS